MQESRVGCRPEEEKCGIWTSLSLGGERQKLNTDQELSRMLEAMMDFKVGKGSWDARSLQ